jgi:hypothetical protein
MISSHLLDSYGSRRPQQDALLRELVLSERLAASPFACQACIGARLRRRAPLAGGRLQRKLEAISELPCPDMAVALRRLRKELSGKTVCSAKQFLLDPAFNLDEIRKNAVLFEDHLSTRERYCPDCLNKHALLMEAFADEALGLDAEKGRWRAVLLRVLPSIHSLRELLDREGGAAPVSELQKAVRRVLVGLGRRAAAQ